VLKNNPCRAEPGNLDVDVGDLQGELTGRALRGPGGREQTERAVGEPVDQVSGSCADRVQVELVCIPASCAVQVSNRKASFGVCLIQ